MVACARYVFIIRFISSGGRGGANGDDGGDVDIDDFW